MEASQQHLRLSETENKKQIKLLERKIISFLKTFSFEMEIILKFGNLKRHSAICKNFEILKLVWLLMKWLQKINS